MKYESTWYCLTITGIVVLITYNILNESLVRFTKININGSTFLTEDDTKFINTLFKTNITTYPTITDAKIHSFHENGYIVIKNVLDAHSINILSTYTTKVFEEQSYFWNIIESRQISCGQLAWIHQSVSDIYLDKLFQSVVWIRILSQLLNHSNISLADAHFHAISAECWKTFNGSGKIHMDILRSPFTPMKQPRYNYQYSTIIVWIPLNDDMTQMQIYPKSHLFFQKNAYEYRASEKMEWEWNNATNMLQNYNKYMVNVTLKKGDIVVFTDSLAHRVLTKKGSTINNSKRISFRYFATERKKNTSDRKPYIPFFSIKTNPIPEECLYQILKKGNKVDIPHHQQYSNECLPRVQEWISYFYSYFMLEGLETVY